MKMKTLDQDINQSKEMFSFLIIFSNVKMAKLLTKHLEFTSMSKMAQIVFFRKTHILVLNHQNFMVHQILMEMVKMMFILNLYSMIFQLAKALAKPLFMVFLVMNKSQKLSVVSNKEEILKQAKCQHLLMLTTAREF